MWSKYCWSISVGASGFMRGRREGDYDNVVCQLVDGKMNTDAAMLCPGVELNYNSVGGGNI